jgi:hypothetical protein
VAIKKEEGGYQMKKAGVFFAFFLVFAIYSYPVSAESLKERKFEHADRNDDGKISKKEWKMEEHWEKSHDNKVNTAWETKADTDGNGKVDAQELSSWKQLEKDKIDLNNDGEIDAKERRLAWRNAKSMVSSSLEKKYDANNDGWLEASEAKDMLKDKYLLVKTDGKAKVDNTLEAEYDSNKDGIIDYSEAQQMKQDIDF